MPMSKQSIYQTLIQSGMTQAACFGTMGNAERESNLEAGRVQGDFSPFRTVSKSYVARVENGSISRTAFAKDGLGFGLCQWTFYSRKYALYDFWKASGKKLDDPEMQAEFIIKELSAGGYIITDKKSTYYGKELWSVLKECNDLYTCTKLVCEYYERPAVNNVDSRFTAAVSLKAELSEIPAEDPGPAVPAIHEFWPPRMICKNMVGVDVMVLQSILFAMDLTSADPDGVFSSTLEQVVKKFQQSNSLDVDGIVGPKSWSKLKEIYFK